MSTRWAAITLGVVLIGGGLLTLAGAGNDSKNWVGPNYGKGFGDQWYDGNAELAGYDLTYPRYGQLRKGSAVAIFVTEPQQLSTRIKPERKVSDSFGVVKLNLMQDFRTGIYDYQMMTSAFAATEPVIGRPAGSITKVSFGAQEWCGHVYHQVLLNRSDARHTGHSYFEGEADVDEKIAHPSGAFAEDALLLWARGLAGPKLEKGGTITVPMLRESAYARLKHVPVEWDSAELTRGKATKRVAVPAGEFEVEVFTCKVSSKATTRLYGGGAVPASTRTWTIHVEAVPPHRIIAWQRDDGLKAELLGSKRLPYWSLNGNGRESMLSEIGLKPRPPRTP